MLSSRVVIDERNRKLFTAFILVATIVFLVILANEFSESLQASLEQALGE